MDLSGPPSPDRKICDKISVTLLKGVVVLGEEVGVKHEPFGVDSSMRIFGDPKQNPNTEKSIVKDQKHHFMNSRNLSAKRFMISVKVVNSVVMICLSILWT